MHFEVGLSIPFGVLRVSEQNLESPVYGNRRRAGATRGSLSMSFVHKALKWASKGSICSRKINGRFRYDTAWSAAWVMVVVAKFRVR